MAALPAAAIGADQHTSRIDLAACQQTYLRSAHPGIRSGFYHVQERAQPLRCGDGIVIEDRQKGRDRARIDLINRCPEAAVFVILDNLHIRSGAKALPRQALAAVIDHDHREIPPDLRLERPDATDKLGIRREGGNGDGYPDFRQASILTRLQGRWIRIRADELRQTV